MSKAEQIVGRLTKEEAVEVLRECIFALPEDELYQVLLDTLTPSQIEELEIASSKS